MSKASLYDKIYELKAINSLSKHEQLVQGIINAIDANLIQKDDKLPSINQMVAELGFARKTIVKAYEELKDRGIVESKKLKGYFVVSEETQQVLKVALILYAFHMFQEDFYNTFRERLGPNVQLDVFFHHNNPEIFETILSNIDKKYGMYVVAPIQSKLIQERLRKISPEKLLIVDRYVPLGEKYSYITQEFEKTTFDKLDKLYPDLKRFDELVLFYRPDADYPIGILKGFERFVASRELKASVLPRYTESSLKKGVAYIFISDTSLFQLLKDVNASDWELGKEIGIITHNDSPVKEIIAGGITTISTDFNQMATLAADSVNNRTSIKKVLPSILIKRNSL
ncbi:MAG: GntR family transcriptional regulator [Bacteroidia bacterium]